MSATEDIRQELYVEFQALEETSAKVSQVVEKYKAFEAESTKKVLEKMKQRAENIQDLFKDNKEELESDPEVKKKHKQFNQTLQKAIGDLAYCKKLGKKYQGSKTIAELCREISQMVTFNFVAAVNPRHTGSFPTLRQNSSPIPSGPNSGVLSTSKYEINFNSLVVGDEIGAGANGKVYEGRYNKTKVALKYSSGVLAADFFKEVELMVNLKPHPNIVQLLGYSRSPNTGEMILVLELCTGGSLEQFRKKNKPSDKQLLTMLSSIAQGLYHLHVNNIVHRDLAARNILLHHKMCKISDFGMSKLHSMQTDQSQTVMKMLPVRWMPPEALRAQVNEKGFVVAYSSKVDVWGFGLIIYELLTGLEPHHDADQLNIGARIRDEGLHPPIPSDCPSALQDLMKQCFLMEPANRPDMSDVCETLEEAMKTVV